MASPFETSSRSEMFRAVAAIEAWVWPVTAAIFVGGSILFWCLVGLFWLATHPAQGSVVIWMAPSELRSEQREGDLASPIALENRRDDDPN
jgi:hypothetical protein